MELPLWMSSSLHTRQFVFVSLPKFMRLKARGNLNADAATVNLSVQSPFFYEMALEAIRMYVVRPAPGLLSRSLHLIRSRFAGWWIWILTWRG